MNIQHTSRSGKVYHLRVKPGKSGKPNYYFSTDPEGPGVGAVPDGFEIYENVGGQVFLRRIPKKLITDAELKLVRAALTAHAEEWRYKIEVKKNMIIIHETGPIEDASRAWGFPIDPVKHKEFRIQHACYQAVLRFILIDEAARRFTPERFCFRGSVDDWIDIGPPAPLPALLKTYVKHLGRDSMFELY